MNKYLRHYPIREWMTGCDLIHVPGNFDHIYKSKPEHCVVTMHDAMFYTCPGVNAQFMRENYTPFAQKCRAVITCSEYSKRDIAEYMDVKEENIFVCPWGYDSEMFHPREKTSNRFTGEAPFFLSVSCGTLRKNTISLIRAYMAFAVNNPDHHLILVWGSAPEEYKEMVAKAGLKDKVHFAGGVDNTELSQLYSSATATFFPSKYEGFGLPILESMVSGTPVVTCRNSSLPEVGGEAALYVEPEDIEAMSHLMEEFENGNIPIAQLKEKCLKQASLFSWTDCVNKTIDVYKRCLGL